MRSQFAVLVGIVALSAWTVSLSAQAPAAGQHEAGAHTHPEAAKMANPVKPTPESIAASSTRTLARQMSGPVPSPSMNGMIG